MVFIIDVLQMLRDGLWTSSLAIPCAAINSAGGTVAVTASITDDTLGSGVARCRAASSVSATKTCLTTCSPSTTHTVTVYDDGTLSIA